MIKSENIRIKKIKNFDNAYIENELGSYNLVRWAVVAVDDEWLTVSVSYIN